MHSALKHIIVFVTLQRHLNDRRGVKFVTFFRKFTKSKLYFTWNSYWHDKKSKKQKSTYTTENFNFKNAASIQIRKDATFNSDRKQINLIPNKSFRYYKQ